MRKRASIQTMALPSNYTAYITVSGGSLSQTYDNSTGIFTPDRKRDLSLLEIHVKGTDPNKASSQITPVITDVDWEFVPSGDGAIPETITGTSNQYSITNDHKLQVKRNFTDKESGGVFRGTAKFADTTTGRSMTISASIPVKTTINTVNALSLVIDDHNGTDPTIPYAGDEYCINPIINPLNTDGDNWKVHCRVQLCDGQLQITDAYKYGESDEADRQGNAFYFWYYRTADGTEVRLTEDNEWFQCKRRKDGTFSKECTVDLARAKAVKLVARAEYIPYGSLVDYMDESGQIKPNTMKNAYLQQTFNLRVSLPMVQRTEISSFQRQTVTERDLQDLTNRIGRRFLITAGGTTLNFTPNPNANDSRNMADVMFLINWYVADSNGDPVGNSLGEGEALNCTLDAIRKEAGLATLTTSNIPDLVVVYEYRYPDLFGNNYCVGYSAVSDDPVPLAQERHGNADFLKQIEFMLFDTTTEDDSGTFEAHTLQRNNLLRYKSGNYAPTVGITKDMEAECTDNALYTDSACKNLLCAAGKYNAVSEWEQHDKPLMAAGGKPRTLYKKDSKGAISEVSHKLRPWETTETKYSIGLGYEFPVYLLDQVKGKSGKVWKGIFTDVTEWDGIDLTPYKLEPTALGPGAFCTVGGKARNFFYLYKGEYLCQGSCGSTDSEWNAANLPSITPFLKDRTYPRSNTSQIDVMNLSRANNKNTSSPYPMSEGGFFALDVVTTAVELMAHTKYIADPDKLFGSGISSNDGINADNFFKYGGVKFKKASDTGYSYASWGAAHKINVDGKSASPNWSNFVNGYAPKEQCMESQMAASMAVELGIKPTTASGSEHYFYFYGGKYYYMGVDGVTSLSDGQMNARVYKVVDYSYTDNTDGRVDCEFILRMSLYSGAMLAGDVFVYSGGGAELVAKAVNINSASYGNPLGFWFESDQTKWKKITSVTIGETEKFGFEDSYKNIIPLDGNTITTQSSWRRNRIPYTPFAATNSSRLLGDCFYLSDENWYNNSAANKKSRLALRFGIYAHNGFCAPRSLFCARTCNYAARTYAGRAQALVRITQ